MKGNEMTRENIIQMAREAGLSIRFHYDESGATSQELERFAQLVAADAIAKEREEFDIDELCARQNKIGYKHGYRAGVLAEREACALRAEEFLTEPEPDWDGGFWNQAIERVAAAIRARGQA